MKIKLKLILVLLLFCYGSYAQLSNFNLTVTATNETCPVSNTVAGSTIVYSVYLLPNLSTPISVLSANSLSGLSAGTYQVIATQSLGNQSGTQSQVATIINEIEPLTYQVTSQKEICGADGVIVVTALSGNPSQYELFAGPITKPLQPSNTFTGLVAGTYQVRVFDDCGEGVVQTHTVQSANPALLFSLASPQLTNCSTVSIGLGFSAALPFPQGIIKYPLQIQTTVFPPSGAPIVTNGTVTSGFQFTTSIPFFAQQPYNYTFTVVDGCGISYTVNGTITNLSPAISYTLLSETCYTKRVEFSNIIALQLISAPAGYPNSLPQDFTSQIVGGTFTTAPLGLGAYVFAATGLCGEQQNISILVEPQQFPPYYFVYGLTCTNGSLAFYNITQIILIAAPSSYTGTVPLDFSATINSANVAVLTNLPFGTYVFSVVDTCQNSSTLVATIVPNNPAPEAAVLKSCSNNNGSVKITGDLTAIQLVSAPSTYFGVLPQDFTTAIISNSEFTLNNLPSGDYVFNTVGSCNNLANSVQVTIPDFQENFNVVEIPNCGSFDLQVSYTSNANTGDTFWLQKYYPASNSWGHPGTGFLYVDGTVPTSQNSFPLTANTTTFNLVFTGQFRVIKRHLYYENGLSLSQNCIRVLYEFAYDGQPEIIDVYSISCNTTFEVVVQAVGLGPLIYRITTKDGAPFLVENGNSNLFSGLTAGLYNFQVEDICGNILNSLFEVNIPNPLAITASTFCPGQSASLSVPNFSFLNYQWWEASNPTVILSTTSSLLFNSFNPSTDAGTYLVQTSYNGNPNSCLNSVLQLTVSGDGFNPQAGNDVSVSYCGSQGAIDLFSLLQGTFTTSGNWQETSSSGALQGSIWNSTAVLPGVYSFVYTVTGNCNLSDDAQLLIEIKAIPDTPTATVDPVLCDGQELHLFASTIPNASYSWSGPNNFSSSLQNPVLSGITSAIDGVYTVKAIVAGCESGTASVVVAVRPLPEFEIEKGCDGVRYLLKVIVTNNSFDPATATFTWSGPNGYTNTGNPIEITREDTGDYTVQVTDENGCSLTKTITVSGTFCEVPNTITPNNDGFNDTFDLSGLGVTRLEIYNRWGRLVFDHDNYINTWYGQNNNNELLPGSTYFYLISLDSGEKKQGWVFVLR
jgi:gliding motility-associated-like protein